MSITILDKNYDIKTTTKLYLSNNQLSSLSAEFCKLVNLQILDLNNNQLSSLPAEIGKLVNLEELYLRDNQLSGLPAEIGKLVNLKKLDLGYTDEYIMSIIIKHNGNINLTLRNLLS